MTRRDVDNHTLTSRSVAQTQAIAAQVAARLGSGGVVALVGALGTGKTQFVRGLVGALGGDERQVHSPTFVLLHEYACGGRKLFHADAYRVGAAELEAIGLDELLASTREGDVVAIEWADKVADLLPADAIHVRIEATSASQRRITIQPPPLSD